MRSRLSAPVCASALLVVAASAQADRRGEAPVRAPQVLHTVHSEFTVLGGIWGQVRNDAGPGSGLYGMDLPMPSGYTCRVGLSVRSTAAKRVGKPEKRVISALRGELLRFDHHGRHGSVRWWSGRDGERDLAAVAVQRAPKAMRTARRRWIVHRIGIGFKAAPGDVGICSSQVDAFGPKVLRRVARTISVAAGPTQAPQPPFFEPVGVG